MPQAVVQRAALIQQGKAPMPPSATMQPTASPRNPPATPPQPPPPAPPPPQPPRPTSPSHGAGRFSSVFGTRRR
ncbi:hypothetical protein BSZ18_21250 [Bradyrhizobium canariense]|uniref:Uncharacterized protein n=1 Tax=Bradyrhizobium canariense TaxID=255045 RepID=A0A1X3H4X2_9BRAD|nr:hypothetical protein BSZ18_21250 [Bradyrhizobium canariense]